MSVKFPPVILGPELAAPILWAPGIFWLFLLENPHAHKIPRLRGGGAWVCGGGGVEVPILLLWAWGFLFVFDFSEVWGSVGEMAGHNPTPLNPTPTTWEHP